MRKERRAHGVVCVCDCDAARDTSTRDVKRLGHSVVPVKISTLLICRPQRALLCVCGVPIFSSGETRHGYECAGREAQKLVHRPNPWVARRISVCASRLSLAVSRSNALGIAVLPRLSTDSAIMLPAHSRRPQNRPRRVGVVSVLTIAIALSGMPRRAGAQQAPLGPQPESSDGSGSGSRPVLPARDDSADQNSVRDLMRAGTAAYAKGDLEAARAAFMRAWELKQHAAIAANLADVEEKLGHFRDAALHWTYVVQHTPTDREKNRTEAALHLDECRRHLGLLHVMTDPGAKVFLDDKEMELGGSGQELLVEPGNHVLRAGLAGRASPAQQFAIGEGEQLTLVLVVPAPQATPRSTSAVLTRRDNRSVPTKRESAAGQTRTVVLVSSGLLAAAALGVGVGFTLRANHLSDEATRLLQEAETEGDPRLVKTHSVCGPAAMPPPVACGSLSAALDERSHARTIARAAFVTGGVIAAGAVVYYLLSAPGKETTKSAAMEVVPWFGEGRRGLELRVAY